MFGVAGGVTPDAGLMNDGGNTSKAHGPYCSKGAIGT